MTKRFLLICALMVFALISGEGDVFAVKNTILPNGLVILTKPVTTNSIVSVIVSLKMGSLYETDDMAGLCTLMQSTIRKGTTNRTSDDIALELESMGTQYGAEAVREYGTIGIQSTKQSLYPSLDILYDLMTNATFPVDAVELQKALQVQSIMANYDEPINYAVDLMVDAHYGSHPFHKPRLGYPEKIQSFSRDDVVSLYEKLYIPNNMVVSAVGNFDEDELIAHITESLGSLPQGADPKPVTGSDNEYVERTEPVMKTDLRDGAATWFCMGWNAPDLSDPDFYAMELLDSITGGSMNSRLFIAIREERGLAYQVSSFYNARRESGIYVAYIGTKPTTYEESKSVLTDEVLRMGTELATEEEIALAKSYLKGMHIMDQESNTGQATQYAHYEIIGVGYDFLETYPEKIDALNADDILRVGHTYLNNNYALGAVIAGD